MKENIQRPAKELSVRLTAWSVALALQVLPLELAVHSAPVQLVEQSPMQITNVAPGVILVDFGRVAFGNLRLDPPASANGNVAVHFGEAFQNGRINRHPPGSVRYVQTEAQLSGDKPVFVAPPASARNTTNPAAVLTPPEWGVVLPFRWVELEGWPGELRPDQIRRRAAFASAWDDDAASFHSSDETLNRIWELCRYSIKATSFAGVYVDGERERISYEADAYLNQLGQYYTEGGVQMARDTFDRLLQQPTWPTEWSAHMIFIAHADWMQTGDTRWLAAHYPALKQELHLDREGPDGLVVSSPAQVNHGDLIDWPVGERDSYIFTPVNTVINAFHLRALWLMSELARALHHDTDAADFTAHERTGRAAFQAKFFDPTSGLYRDGEGTDHSSLHANLFPLAFGLVPELNRAHVARWLGERGMACSVYAAQYLLEGLFESDCASNALALMTAPGDRSWKHMLDSGTSITWEAWDQRYKANQDWTHAWGSAPANLLPRFILGVQPLAPGWSRAAIHPDLGLLKSAEGKVPTPLGPVLIRCKQGDNFKLSLILPAGMTAQVQVPASKTLTGVLVRGKPARVHREGRWWVLDEDIAGTAQIETGSATFSQK